MDLSQWHGKSGTKPSGGKRLSLRRRDKILCHKGSDPTNTVLSKADERFTVATKRAGIKVKARKAKFASVVDKKAHKVSSGEIINVVENPANRQFARRNIITKGALIEVRLGTGSTVKARVTSRPGQSGSVQAVVVQ